MSQYYLDASALVKRYVDEKGYPSLTFLSADGCLNQAAAVEGLTVDNPNQHP